MSCIQPLRTYKAFCLASIWMLDIIGNKKIITMTYGYIRVSSDKQTVENQRFTLMAG